MIQDQSTRVSGGETMAATTLGSSLPVPCVQELAKESSDTVPPRYIRSDESHYLPVKHHDNDIPVVDMSGLVNGDLLELDNLDSASKEWGFFQLVNHGVDSSLLEDMKKQTHDLFNLPMEEKRKYWQQPGDIEGFGQSFVVSAEQKLDWGDRFYLKTLPAQNRNPCLFAKLPHAFRETVEAYSREMKKLALKIINFQAKALKIDPEYIRYLFEEGTQTTRMNYYPPCPQPEKVVGVSPHSDVGALTILLQLNEIEGLEIKKDGFWVPIKPLPNAFVINIGDSMEIVTNGIYRSIEHRAMVNFQKERLSIGAFYSPKLDSEMGPALSLVTTENPAKFKQVGAADHFKGFYARKLDGKLYLDEFRISDNGSLHK